MSSSSESHGTHDLNRPTTQPSASAVTISDARLAEMLAGLEGVTPGPYVTSRRENRPRDGASYEIGAPDRGVAGMMYAKDAAHFKRCDPDTMRAILTELAALRSALALTPAGGREEEVLFCPQCGWNDQMDAAPSKVVEREALQRIAAIKYPSVNTHYALKATIDYARDQARAALNPEVGE